MRTLKLVLAYDGTAYHGWQFQANGVTVQQVVEECIERILGPHRTVAAGRTDAGVHALGQVASFRTEKDIETQVLLNAMNANLPKDIAVLSVEEAAEDFNPRKNALSKLYRYRIYEQPIRPVLVRNLVWQVWNIDWEKVTQAAKVLVGTHDFASFQGANRAEPVGDPPKPEPRKSTTRTITRLELIRTPPAEHEVWFEIEGDGFLKHMVRNIVGTLIQVGRGVHPPWWVADVLAAKDRRTAGVMAPGSGLTLVEVRYA